MGNRKYIYLAFLAAFALMYFGVHRRNESYGYRCPLGSDKTVAIILYGNTVRSADLSYVRHLIESVYQVRTEVVQRDVEELRAAYDPQRRQYNVDRLLDGLEAAIPEQYFRALVLLNEDIYADGTNFVLGTGDNPGRAAAMTTAGYGLNLFGLRLENVIHKKIMRVLAIHELGHTLGLVHCDKKCVMEFGNNVIQEAKKYDQYCPSCERKLHDLALQGYPTYQHAQSEVEE